MSATPEQLEVIQHRGSHLLVPAVPGSGKTFAMVERAVSLLEEGVDASRLLVMMFNVSAKDDFQTRLRKKTQEKGLPMPEVQTFHAFGMKLCKAMEKRQIIKPYRLEDKAWVFQKMARAALQMANEGLSEEDKIPDESQNVEQLLEYIEYAKNEFCEISSDELPAIEIGYIDAINYFEDLRHEAKLRTFTDLLYDPALQINNDQLTEDWVSNRYDHIIGDEAQDMNQLQITMMSWIAGTRAQVCIVGDEDQSIYEWRGSRPEFMVKLFEEQFPDAKRIPLTRTFRYGHGVSLLANHVIQKNKLRMDKLCIPGTSQKTKIDVDLCDNGLDGKAVLVALKKWQRDGHALDQCAVLLREYSHSVSIETELLESNVPYKLVGAPPFFQRREALALRGSLLLASDGLDSVSDPDQRRAFIHAMLSVPTCYLKADAIDALLEFEYPTANSFIGMLGTMASNQSFSSGVRKKLNQRAAALSTAINVAANKGAGAFIDTLITELDMHEAIFKESGKFETAMGRWRTIIAIKDLAIQHKVSTRDMVRFLDDLNTRYEAMSTVSPVLLTSIHRSKGLEWPHVIVPGLKEGSFPSYPPDEPLTESEMESERRLYYVGITRAKERLTLVGPKDSYLYKLAASGNHMPPENTDFYASRFLYESNMQWSMVVGAELEEGGLTDATSKDLDNKPPLMTKLIKHYLSSL